MKKVLFSLSLGVVLAQTCFHPASASLASALAALPVGVAVAQAADVEGKVDWFDESKGFGYITPSDGSKRFLYISAQFKATDSKC